MMIFKCFYQYRKSERQLSKFLIGADYDDLNVEKSFILGSFFLKCNLNMHIWRDFREYRNPQIVNFFP